MENILRLTFSSSVENISEVNDSFDRGVLRVCYTGANRNKTIISKSAIEDAIPTMYNCPIVCNYNVYEDTIGGHDMDIINTADGIRLINLTDAVGVVPDGASYSWEVIDDGDARHEYFCVDVILWKRSAAYKHIKENGITSQSMEISVKDGFKDGGLFNIKKFTFTAFCLLGDDVEPCFEGASLEMFSIGGLREKFTAMMKDVKTTFTEVSPSLGVDINGKLFAKGGTKVDNKIAILAEFGLTVDDIDFSITDISEDELRSKLNDIRKFDDEPGEEGTGEETGNDTTGNDNSGNDTTGNDTTGNDTTGNDTTGNDNTETDTPGEESEGGSSGGSGDDSSSGGSNDSGSGSDDDDDDESSGTSEETSDDDDDDEKPKKKDFSLLAEQIVCGLVDAVKTETYTDPVFGEMCRYGYADFDPESNKAYFLDYTNFKYYSFVFSFDGDNINVDFGSKKRAKLTFVDFDEGSSGATYSKMLSPVKDCVCAEKIEKTLEQFADLEGKSEFEALRDNHSGMSVEDVENKCFEIRGRYSMNFSANTKRSTRIPVGQGAKESSSEPYNGLFLKYLENN